MSRRLITQELLVTNDKMDQIMMFQHLPIKDTLENYEKSRG